MPLRTWLLSLGPGRSRTQLERHGDVEGRSRIDCARSLPGGPPSNLHRLTCHAHRDGDGTGVHRGNDRMRARFVSLWIKLSDEEEVMGKQFPEQYAAYRERVKRIIPFVL